MRTTYGLAELQAMPVISEGHFDNLVSDKPTLRIWLSRMTKEDGMPYDNMVTIEHRKGDESWKTTRKYQAETRTNRERNLCPCECTCGEECDPNECPCVECVSARTGKGKR